MPQKLIWTDPRDAQLRRLRGDGASWDEIAASLRVSRCSAITRGRVLQAEKPSKLPVEPRPDLAREPFPAGHPLSWNILVAGTVLEGSDYR